MFRLQAKIGKQMNASDILEAGQDAMSQRAATRDQPQGERSMARCVKIFNACTDLHLTESQGWLFMECLKTARSLQGGFNVDDYIDGAAYTALRGECDSGC